MNHSNSGELLEEWHTRQNTEKQDLMKINSSGIGLSSTMRGILKPARDLPERCISDIYEPITSDTDNVQGDELIEDWPSCSIKTQDWQSVGKKLRPNVYFSDLSSMHIYIPDPCYSRNNYYSPEERKHFSKEALSEAIRIKRLLLSTAEASTKCSLKYLLMNKIIAIEEVVGLEHLVFCKSTRNIFKERKDHVRAVVAEQSRVKNTQEDPTNKLGEFSASSSIKSIRNAKNRGSMARAA